MYRKFILDLVAKKPVASHPAANAGSQMRED